MTPISAPETEAFAPMVSVITATFNWSSVLRYAIQSVLWQTLTDLEMLVVGDGCTDDSGEVVSAFADSRLHWHNLPHNSGHQSTPNNYGLARARGQYVAYLGHDDVWLPTHLELLLKAIKENDADIAHAFCALIGPPGSGIRALAGASGKPYGQVWLPPSSLMHRRSLTDAIGPWQLYTELDVDPETDLLQRAARHGSVFVTVDRVTVFKFPASWRQDSYREKRSEEQAAYLRRIQAEPDFLERELVAIASAYAQNNTRVVPAARKPRVKPRGWHVEQNRRFRGLAARQLPSLSIGQHLLVAWYALTSPLRRLLLPFKRTVGRFKHKRDVTRPR